MEDHSWANCKSFDLTGDIEEAELTIPVSGDEEEEDVDGLPEVDKHGRFMIRVLFVCQIKGS